jgi:hypothetical protein
VGKIGHYIKELGLPFTLWWTGAWIISGFAVYALISSGLVGGGDAIGRWAVGVGRIFDLDNITPGVGNLAVTIVINEVRPCKYTVASALVLCFCRGAWLLFSGGLVSKAEGVLLSASRGSAEWC